MARRKEAAAKRLAVMPPDAEESRLIHDIHMNLRTKGKIPGGKFNSEETKLMGDAWYSDLAVCHPKVKCSTTETNVPSFNSFLSLVKCCSV